MIKIDLNKDVNYILDSMAGSLVIDKDERLKFMSKDLMDTIGVESFDTIKGRKLRDVINSNNTYKVLETGEAQIGETYFVQGYTVVSNAFPIYKENKIIGAIEVDIFQDIDILQDFFDKIATKKDLKLFSESLKGRKREKYSLNNIKGSSNAIKKLKNEIKMASRSNSTVLVTGETGTGKEMIAHAIHLAGHRSIFEFVEINCASIPSELFESELFGYEEGSFTGAKKGGKKGLVEMADKGTLFLDEINALPLSMQAKLLRFIQEKEIQKVGGEKTMPVDIRIIAASNKDLHQLVRDGEFREDLYYRLNVIDIIAEPLRKRKTDIPELVNYFIEMLNVELGRNSTESLQIKNIDNEALKLLIDHDWQGNVRELQNAIERAINRCNGHTLLKEHFEEIEAAVSGKITDDNGTVEVNESYNLKQLKSQLEKNTISNLINVRKLGIIEAAEALGITRQMLHRKMKEYDIKAERK